eukprot:6204731-Pleurochrysis_carterae.AAC.2
MHRPTHIRAAMQTIRDTRRANRASCWCGAFCNGKDKRFIGLHEKCIVASLLSRRKNVKRTRMFFAGSFCGKHKCRPASSSSLVGSRACTDRSGLNATFARGPSQPGALEV